MDWRSSLANHLASRARDSIWERIYIFRVAQIKAGEILFDQHFKPAPSAKSQTSIGTTILKSRILRQSYAPQINEACEKGIARCKSRHFDWVSEAWRRRRDSNPRDPFGPNGFQDRRFQPLTHSSAHNSNALRGLVARLCLWDAASRRRNRHKAPHCRRAPAFAPLRASTEESPNTANSSTRPAGVCGFHQRRDSASQSRHRP